MSRATANIRDAFRESGREIEFEKGDCLIRGDDATSEVFLLLTGRLCVEGVAPSGRHVIYEELEPTTVFGELGAIDGAPRSAFVTAASDGRALAVPVDDFREMMARNRELVDHVLSRMARAIRRSDDRVRELCTMNAQARIARELARMTKVGGATGSETIVPALPSHQELAARCGTTRETVTRTLRVLDERGVVVREGALAKVQNLEALVTAFDDDGSPTDAQTGRPRRSRC